MEPTSTIKEALNARSEVASLEELEQRGKHRVKIIRADHIAAMIDSAVSQVRSKFETALVQRQHRIEELDEELASANERLAHFEALYPGGLPASSGGRAAAATPASSGGPAGGGDLANALDQLSDAMGERLDQMSKKLGISTAVEGDDVNLEHLFEDHGDVQIESNMDDLQVKKTTSSGIAANLERLKKLKGGN